MDRQDGALMDEGPREVVIWSYYETMKQKEGLDRLVEGFNNRQKDYVARWEYQGPSSEFKKLLSIGVAEGNLPDVVIIDNPDMRKYVELGIFEDITETVKADYDLAEFYPEVISSVQYDGRYYGVPFCCNNVGLVYNRDMFREAGIQPPQDWEQFIQAAETMTTQDRYGFTMSAILEEQSSFQLVPWLLSTGEDMESLGGEGTVKALSMLAHMVEKGYMPRDCINWSQVDVARQFAAGKCAMMENGPWALPLAEEAGIDPNGKYIGFGLRNWKGLDTALPEIAAAANYAYEKHGLTPVFVPIEFPSDLMPAERVGALLHCPWHAVRTRQPIEVTIGILSRMKTVVGIRLHSLMFSAGQGVPVVGMSYDIKVDGFLKYIGSRTCLQLSSVKAEPLCRLIDECVSGALDNEVHRTAEMLRERESENVKGAAKLLNISEN